MHWKILFLAILLLLGSAITTVTLSINNPAPNIVRQHDNFDSAVFQKVPLSLEDVDNPGGG